MVSIVMCVTQSHEMKNENRVVHLRAVLMHAYNTNYSLPTPSYSHPLPLADPLFFSSAFILATASACFFAAFASCQILKVSAVTGVPDLEVRNKEPRDIMINNRPMKEMNSQKVHRVSQLSRIEPLAVT